jgi:uncharacterized protein (TIGR03435 family)
MRMVASVTLLVSVAAVAQTPNTRDTRPQFEAASIQPTEPGIKIGVHFDGTTARYVAVPLRDSIAMASRVRIAQLSGPAWLADAKFDISAKLPAGTTSEQIPEMMQALLEQRFKLECRRQSKDLPVYVLTVGKGPLKLKESVADPDASAPTGNVDVSGRRTDKGSVVSLGPGASVTDKDGRLDFKGVTIDQLLNSIERYVDRPVFDKTGLTGVYDVTIQYSVEELRTLLRVTAPGVTVPDSAAASFPGSIPNSFESLGLKLEPRPGRLDTVVIDRIEKTPTQN